MPDRILHPEWREQHEPTRYPFAERASLTNGSQTVLEGLLLDAILHPVGGQESLYLSRVEIQSDLATIHVGDGLADERASGSFDLVDPPDQVALTDARGRPAGLLVSESTRLAVLQSWGLGTHVFQPDQTAFAGTVCVPVPAEGVRGVELDDGTVLTGDIWLVGGPGVVLSRETRVEPPAACGGADRKIELIRVDVTGDPLFRRRLCVPDELFQTPRLLRSITFDDGRHRFTCHPDQYGDFKMTVGNDLAADTVLRLRSSPEGIRLEAEGSELQDVR